MTILLTADLVVLQHAPDGAHDAGGVGAPHRGGGRRHAQPALLIRGVNQGSRSFYSGYNICGQASQFHVYLLCLNAHVAM